MTRYTICFVGAVLLLWAGTAQADTLVLHGGKKLDGTFLGGNSRQVDFMTADGQTQHIPITNIANISFSAPVTAAAKPAAAPAAAPAAKRPSVTIPQGTLIRVRTVETIDVDSSQAGMKFRASIDDPIMVGGGVVVPRGADATLQAAKVQQSGKMKGSDLIQLKINSIVINGKPYAVTTSFQEVKGGSEGKSTAKKGLGGAGLGAIIGGIAGGGTGAAIGAAVGGGAGLAISASGQQHLKVPAESRLEFRLEAAVAVAY
jgi:hypothetical protein